ncbi:FecR domain-containing protein [Parabacteroides sp. OttesenSCG-928-K15]|nr:FecR domain-containing protein [Parabacteroides sp. OttesenSCG-928-K15]
MNDKKRIDTTGKLLRDRRFILWCIAPTEELHAEWHSWLEAHPEEQPAVDRARILLKSLRMNDYTVPEGKSKQLWERLQASLQQKRAQRQQMFLRYAAAVVAVLLISATGYRLFRESELSKNMLVDAGQLIEDIQTEVTLIFDSRDTLHVEDNALIAYQSDITVKAKEQERVISPKSNESLSKKGEYNTLVVPKGRRSSLLLADGSKVWVNSGSVLRFPTRFDADHRSIEVEGEIYIEVAKSHIPFYVKTNEFRVNVLGTKFNISAYKEEEERSVVLVEGSVEVETADNRKISLSPDRKLSLQGSENRIEEVDVYDYISWKDGLLQFKGETMQNILARLSRYYNVPIKCPTDIEERRSSGKLVLFEDIHQVMETFSILYDTHYRFESDTLLIE